MSKIYVLYHASCTDGTGAKYAAWKRLGDAAEYIPVQYGKPVPNMEPNSRVFIVDFSYPIDVINGLLSVHAEVMILDHHKTAEEALRGCKCAHFDMAKSGAVLAWEYFHPGVPVPNLLLNIQDRDLWKFKLNFSKEVHEGLQLFEGDMEKWWAAAETEESYWKVVESGQTLMLRKDMVVKSSLKKTKVVDFQGLRAGVINATDYASEIGNAIVLDPDLKADLAIIYCITKEDYVVLSFRSDQDKDVDVSKLAAKYGGGGHKAASGARIELPTLINLIAGKE